MNYAIINYINNECLRFSDSIALGITLDHIFDSLDRYELPYKVISYNFGKVYVIK